MRSQFRRPTAVALLVLTMLVSAAWAPVAVAATGTDSQTVGSQQATSSAVAQQATPTETPTPGTNNTSVRHEDPRKVGEDGNIQAVRRHLAKELAERLGQSTVQLSQGQYQQAKRLLGDGYSQSLEKLVDVEGETEGSKSSDTFEQAQKNQREFVETVQSYNETYQEYREAKRNGNEARARKLARELEQLSERANRTSQDLTRSYTRLENQTGADLSAATRRVQQIQQNISEQQAAVIQTEFDKTNISVSAPSERVSYLDPLPLTGRLTTENGTPLANRTIRVAVGGKRVQVQTNAEGEFAFTYQPVTAPLSTSTLSVRYLPASDSVYLGANSSLVVDIVQTNATVNLTSVTRTASFGDLVAVRGQVVAGDVPVRGVPVRVTVGGVSLGVVRTDSDGRFALTTALPAAVPAGEHTVAVQVAQRDRAVTSNVSTRSMTVETTSTTLSVNASLSDPGESSAVVTGTLRTSDGRPLANQPIQIHLAGSTVATLRTGSDGEYRATVSLPDGARGTVTVEAVFESSGTNLDGASATTQLSVPEPGDGSPKNSTTPGNWLIAVALGALVFVGGVFWWVRSSEPEPVVSESAETTVSATETDSPSDRLLTRAHDLLATGESDAAVEIAYMAVRRSLASRYDIDSSGTHWEFFRTAAEQLDDEQVDRLRTLTERYEGAVYKPSSLGTSAADAAIEDSMTLVG